VQSRKRPVSAEAVLFAKAGKVRAGAGQAGDQWRAAARTARHDAPVGDGLLLLPFADGVGNAEGRCVAHFAAMSIHHLSTPNRRFLRGWVVIEQRQA
jgi:hypothetical protein